MLEQFLELEIVEDFYKKDNLTFKKAYILIDHITEIRTVIYPSRAKQTVDIRAKDPYLENQFYYYSWIGSLDQFKSILYQKIDLNKGPFLSEKFKYSPNKEVTVYTLLTKEYLFACCNPQKENKDFNFVKETIEEEIELAKKIKSLQSLDLI